MEVVHSVETVDTKVVEVVDIPVDKTEKEVDRILEQEVRKQLAVGARTRTMLTVSRAHVLLGVRVNRATHMVEAVVADGGAAEDQGTQILCPAEAVALLGSTQSGLTIE